MAADVDEPVAEDERFFRRILPNSGHFKVTDDGLRVSSSAFSDRKFEPSIDREKLALPLGGPAFTQDGPGNGVVSVTASDVRGIKFDHPLDNPIDTFVADVEPRPLDHNPAHYVVLLKPATKKKGVFKKLIERLARRAEWVIEPDSSDVTDCRSPAPGNDSSADDAREQEAPLPQPHASPASSAGENPTAIAAPEVAPDAPLRSRGLVAVKSLVDFVRRCFRG